MKLFLYLKNIVVVFFLLLFASKINAQERPYYVKGNGLLATVGLINLGVEHQISERYTIQGDFFISPWKQISNNHAQIYMGHIEGRYYFDKAFSKWYVGLNTGFGLFDITKWNYFNTNAYQRGFNCMFGGAMGYQWQVNSKWNIDLFIGGGFSEGFYHGYKKMDSGEVKRVDGATRWNKSGEWLIYRGGVMISYRIK